MLISPRIPGQDLKRAVARLRPDTVKDCHFEKFWLSVLTLLFYSSSGKNYKDMYYWRFSYFVWQLTDFRTDGHEHASRTVIASPPNSGVDLHGR